MVTILDKSAYQSLSLADHRTFDKYFHHNLTPILAVEVLADLSREGVERTPEQDVQILAKKFGGSGPVINADYQKLLLADLLGHGPPLTFQVPVDYGKLVEDDSGETGLVLDLHAINEDILRWRKGEFHSEESKYASLWRTITTALPPDRLAYRLEQAGVVLPDERCLKDASTAIDDLLETTTTQKGWLSVVLSSFGFDKQICDLVLSTRSFSSPTTLKEFAPYAHHCLRVNLLVAVATKRCWVAPRPTNNIDVQYLYYLPFCHIFCSQDKLHRTLAPYLIRSDQSFVWASDLKKSLRTLSHCWAENSHDERHQLLSRPPESDGCIVTELWNKHCRPFASNSDPEVPISQETMDRIQKAARSIISRQPENLSETSTDDVAQIISLRKTVMSKKEICERFGAKFASND